MLRYANPWHCAVTNMGPAISTTSPTGGRGELHSLSKLKYSPLRTNWIPQPLMHTNVVFDCQKSDRLAFGGWFTQLGGRPKPIVRPDTSQGHATNLVSLWVSRP